MGKLYNGVVYDSIKRSRHTYHYSVRRVKKRKKINIQKRRLADTLYDNTNFGENVSYLNQASKSLPDVVDKASGCKQVSQVFLEKYKTIYTSVPTPDNVMAHITDEISNRISNTDCNVNVTPDVVNDCIAKLKRGKSDGDIGFNSNHLAHSGRCIRVLLSLLFNAMIVYGHYLLGLTWSCSATSNRQLGHHEVSTVVSSLHHPGCCSIQESRGDQEYC